MLNLRPGPMLVCTTKREGAGHPLQGSSPDNEGGSSRFAATPRTNHCLLDQVAAPAGHERQTSHVHYVHIFRGLSWAGLHQKPNVNGRTHKSQTGGSFGPGNLGRFFVYPHEDSGANRSRKPGPRSISTMAMNPVQVAGCGTIRDDVAPEADHLHAQDGAAHQPYEKL